MKIKKSAFKLYLLNLALLVTHEIDSAYWHEWKLFNLPGEIDGFLIMNFLLILAFLSGIGQVIEWKKYAVHFYVLLALSGIFAFSIHTYFIFAGHSEFNTAVSWAILILTFIVSLAQLIVLILIKRRF